MITARETNLVKLVKQHVQDLKASLDEMTLTPAPTDNQLNSLINEFAIEFSQKTPGFFPGQIGPNRLMDYHNRFMQFVPGYAGRNGVRIQSPYSREVTLRIRFLLDSIYTDLQNPSVKIPWLIDKLGRLFIRNGSVESQLTYYVNEKADNLDRELKGLFK